MTKNQIFYVPNIEYIGNTQLNVRQSFCIGWKDFHVWVCHLDIGQRPLGNSTMIMFDHHHHQLAQLIQRPSPLGIMNWGKHLMNITQHYSIEGFEGFIITETGLHTENFFQNLIKSNWNQVVFTISSIDLEQQTNAVRLLFQINRIMINTIWIWFDLIWFWKDFSLCVRLERIRHLSV